MKNTRDIIKANNIIDLRTTVISKAKGPSKIKILNRVVNVKYQYPLEAKQ